MSKDPDFTQADGRGNDGWFYIADLADGRSVPVADHDNIQAVWARVREAQKKDDDFFFSGARHADKLADGTISVGKVDGIAILPAKSIMMLRNQGLATSGIHEGRLARIEAAFQELGEAQNELREDLDDTIDELEEKGVIEKGPNGGQAGGEPPSPEPTAVGATTEAPEDPLLRARVEDESEDE